MITIYSRPDGTYLVRGESGDTKPIDAVPGNSKFEELDTGISYFYRASVKEWVREGCAPTAAADVKFPKIAYQPDSTATTVAALRADLNEFIDKVRAAGLMDAT